MDDFLLHALCDYMYEIATVFSEFWDNCYVVEKDRTTGTINQLHLYLTRPSQLHVGHAYFGLIPPPRNALS